MSAPADDWMPTTRGDVVADGVRRVGAKAPRAKLRHYRAGLLAARWGGYFSPPGGANTSADACSRARAVQRRAASCSAGLMFVTSWSGEVIFCFECRRISVMLPVYDGEWTLVHYPG